MVGLCHNHIISHHLITSTDEVPLEEISPLRCGPISCSRAIILGPVLHLSHHLASLRLSHHISSLHLSHPLASLHISHHLASSIASSLIPSSISSSHPCIYLIALHPFIYLITSYPFIYLSTSHPFIYLIISSLHLSHYLILSSISSPRFPLSILSHHHIKSSIASPRILSSISSSHPFIWRTSSSADTTSTSWRCGTALRDFSANRPCPAHTYSKVDDADADYDDGFVHSRSMMIIDRFSTVDKTREPSSWARYCIYLITSHPFVYLITASLHLSHPLASSIASPLIPSSISSSHPCIYLITLHPFIYLITSYPFIFLSTSHPFIYLIISSLHLSHYLILSSISSPRFPLSILSKSPALLRGIWKGN